MPTTFWWHSHFCHFCQLFSYGITRMWWRCCRCCGGAYGASFWLMFCLSCHWHLCEAFSLDPDFDYDNTEGLSSKVESHIGRSLRNLLANYTTSLQLLVEEVTNMTPCIYIWHRVYIYICLHDQSVISNICQMQRGSWIHGHVNPFWVGMLACCMLLRSIIVYSYMWHTVLPFFMDL